MASAPPRCLDVARIESSAERESFSLIAGAVELAKHRWPGAQSGRHRHPCYRRAVARTLTCVDSGPERESRIVDLTKVSLTDLPTVVSERLKKSLREVVDQVGQQHEVVAGFGSAI